MTAAPRLPPNGSGIGVSDVGMSIVWHGEILGWSLSLGGADVGRWSIR
jgi:hypothetical protein